MAELRVFLIDFGMASSYLNEKGEHLPNNEIPYFQGNLGFASVNTLNFKRSSRKDDLMSLCYLLVTLLNGGLLPCLDYEDDYTPEQLSKIENMRKFKGKYTL